MEAVEPLSAIVAALKPLNSEDRKRTVEAALHYLGEVPLAQTDRPNGASPFSPSNGDEHPAALTQWLRNNDVSSDDFDRVIYLGDGDAFDIHDVPGKKPKKRQSTSTFSWV